MAKEEFPVEYCNMVKIAHSPFEFLVDFKLLSPESPNPDETPTAVRIVLHPTVAKSLVQALSDNIRNFEANFGAINTPTPGPFGTDHLH